MRTERWIWLAVLALAVCALVLAGSAYSLGTTMLHGLGLAW